ncbi:hypothetical protein [Limosilactobacillus vaginalis]|uniref:hypothetical protein n=1 Tax=Limosilactobacillus vaginalis TaxID=1633 RepID=UPI0025A38AD8|nr:hypothetical protein [Limosilactobacillus vaginalis]MDM8222123.1 hypothetical protein [Limosilactobacillus vaginalis]
MSLDLPHTKDLATNSKLPGYIAANNLATEAEDKQDDQNFTQEVQERKAADAQESADRQDKDTKLDQKYSKITNEIIARCDGLQEGEEKLDSDKASKVMLYKWWKELDDKFSACVDELDDKKASKKHVHRTFEALSQLIQQYHDDIVKIANDNEQKMNDKAERVALGTDMDTVRQVVMLILQEQGIVPATAEIPQIKDPDKAASAAGEVAAVSSGEDSRAQAASAALAELNLPKE